MNICSYIINNEKLYGLITVILKTRLDLYPYGFSIWMDATDSLSMVFYKYRTYSNKSYWGVQVSTARDHREYHFVKRVTPNEHSLDIWKPRGVI